MLRGIFLDSDIMYLSLEAWKVKSKYNLGFVSCHNPSYIVKDQKVKMKVTQSCPTLPDPMDCIVQGRNTGVGSLFLLQGIFPTQRLNLGLPPCRQILYQLSHKGSPRSCFKYIIIWEDPISSVVTGVFFFFFLIRKLKYK